MPPPIKLVQQALPGMSQLCDSPERTAGTFLKTAATVFSRWFLVMRAAASRERARQQEYRIAHNLKNKVKVPSRPLELVDMEKQTEEYSESIIRSMFGDEVADYARTRFACALSTGDMRAFKIRLLMLKARNSLQGPLQDEFSKWTDRYIEQAEADAGCKPCPGPRRMSRAEKERKRLRKAANDYYEEEWFRDHEEPPRLDMENPPPSASPAKGEVSTLDTPSSGAKKDGGRKRKASDILSKTVSGSLPPVAGLVSSMCKVMGGATIEDMAALIVEESPVDTLESASEEKVEKTSHIEKSGPVRALENSVTVTSETPKTQYLETHGRRTYDSVAEVMEDMAAGRTECYKTPGEVVAAMKQGKMMPHEAMLFISAMDKLSGDKKKGRRPATRRAKLEQIPPEEEEEEIDSEDRFSNRDEGGEGDGAAAYSYNPNGFGGCYQGDYNW